ncbi:MULTISPECIES: response regulator transcription factor [Candidatus Microthrix]|jgi:two-component system response regulator RegX3|uniref:Sensory transduction protein RegX3 n=1 Tax=Candidatus Neomicrothrix parvicella RN1 TaxID=1229780 RepID=R4Z3J6_9ACTN|nr:MULTISPECIES: response regulator transcription factor [Microthrix]NLH66832.1 response regulator transcription factor [Candidatus Microthrix parvicella]MBK7018588.1 response regulator transcription factor [Candidatus Microthrix sp.]MBK7321947.1 response regulator transcription factor [Candidatus Microthrix sp.]MBL0205824.1 response regulator transcription factor [Candidatus Microthrix sp.]MBP6135271.1 response regulator transcription factor [Candidatus Microthrix sp.]
MSRAERASQAVILVVEDEESYVDALTVGLGREGFEVVVARTGAEALTRFSEVNPDLVLLDVMLPNVSGLDVCREIRASSNVPIIMVTAKSSEIDTVVGLEVGADDYVTKPYRLRELVARIGAVMRRRSPTPVDGERDTDGAMHDPLADRLVGGDVTVDLDRHEVTVRGEPVNLPLKEFDLLTVLLENPGRVLSRATLIDRVWGGDYVGDTKTLDVHIKRLRSRVEPNPSTPERIVTVRGVGYKFQSVS